MMPTLKVLKTRYSVSVSMISQEASIQMPKKFFRCLSISNQTKLITQINIQYDPEFT
jgi:hypothetical protein